MTALPAGYTVRPVTRGDLNTATEFVNMCLLKETGKPAMTEAEMLNEWNTPGFTLDTDCWAVIAPDGTFAAYAEFWNVQEPHVRSFVWARVHPDHRGRGIGTYLLQRGEAWAREFIAQCPPEARVSMAVFTYEVNQDALDLFANAGFTHNRTFYRMKIEMDAPPPAPVWPQGITVRTLRDTDDDLRAAVAANEEAFQDHWGHLPVSFDKWKHWIDNDPDFDKTLYFLAMDGDAIAATCFCKLKTTEDPDMGWVDDLGVRRPWRRRGLAQALLLHAFGEFYRRGQRKAGLGVDATSLTNATRLYEKVGMRNYWTSLRYEKELRPGVELATTEVDDMTETAAAAENTAPVATGD